MIAYLVVFLTAAVTTFTVTPVVRRLVIRWGAVDQPSDRKVHPVAAPTMGGLAMFVGFLVAMGVSRFLPFFKDMNQGSSEPLAAVVTCTLMVGLGVIDDKRGTSALAKLTAQIFIAGVLVLIGVQVVYFWLGPTAGIVNVSSDLAVPLTIAWVVIVCNAVNLVDGLDGLAAGMMGIAAVAFFVYMVRTPGVFELASSAALLSSITAGICVGFLPWNFHPAKIFMGDTGAMLLGMLLAIATISGSARNALRPAPGDIAVLAIPILTPLLVLFVPFLDVVLAVSRRTRRGQGIGHADKEHLHHRLLDIGHSHRLAVLLMYLWTGLIAVSGLAVGFINGRLVVAIVMLASIVLFLVTALPRLTERPSPPPRP
ncbi:MAG: UDP-GlcNAc:undecaprenyl-phosphate/decaprenyl-phosphate GlcNAc-phosphate transferase [Actinomycetota bacterium]|jgi:UDP-GlcNAc:undecaprenyl-phosphate GlcNAc-1-phosphate transferase|nr:UDP-GlcNAc:undecaprenyl-phosphate/decaprenyl-phosphate GlcNAc-phosphate transferase [Actinomycetota bacterium]